MCAGWVGGHECMCDSYFSIKKVCERAIYHPTIGYDMDNCLEETHRPLTLQRLTRDEATFRDVVR